MMQVYRGKINKLFLILLLTGGIESIIAAARFSSKKTHNNINYRLPDNVIPNYYFIELKPDLNTFDKQINIFGTSSIEIQVVHATSTIVLNFMGLIIEAKLTNVYDESYSPQMTHDNKKQMIFLYFDEMLERGTYILKLKYTTFPNKNGVVGISYMTGKEKIHLLVANLLPIGARELFPCWDEPHLRAKFRISVKTPNLMVFSAMRQENRSTELDQKMSMHFNNTPAISAYSMGMVIGPANAFTCIINENTIPNTWCRRSTLQMGPAYILSGNIARELAWYTNNSLKLDKMYHIVIPGIQGDTITSWRLAIYEEKDFIYDEHIEPIAKELRIIRLITRAMAHQYLISPLWWNHLWLNEGFAGFFHGGNLFKTRLDWRMQDLFVIHIQHEALHLDVNHVMMPLQVEKVNSPSRIKSIFSYSLYIKAPVIFVMLEHIVTPEVLRNGIIKYLDRHKFGYVTPDDLWVAIQAALDETDTKHTNYIVKDAMHSWITQKGYPVVYVERDYHAGEAKIWQETYRLNLLDNIRTEKWCIPITFTTESELNFFRLTPRIWLKPNMSNIKLSNIDKDEWIIINLRQSGYYRVNYDEKNWRYIANYLKSNEFRNIPVLNRAQIIDDAFHLMIAGELNHTVFLDLMAYLSKELDYVAWYPALKIFEYLSGYLPFQESDFLKERMLKILNGVLRSIDFVENMYETDIAKCLRVEIARWLCTLDNFHCMRAANFKLQSYLENSDTQKIAPAWKYWTFCKGLMKADLNTWNRTWFYLIGMKKTQQRIFEFLSCTENPTILKIFLHSIMEQETLTYKERINVLYSIIVKHAKNNLDVILDIYDHILRKQMMEDKIKMFSIIINHVYSSDGLFKIEKYAQENQDTKHIFGQIRHMLIIRWKRIHHHLNKFLRWFRIVPKRPSKYSNIERTESQVNVVKSKSEYRLPAYVIPMHYYIDLTIPEYNERSNFTINGTCDIIIRLAEERRSIMLHSAGLKSPMNIHELSLTDARIHESNDKYSDIRNTYHCDPSYNSETEILTLNFKTELSRGYYNLSIKFDNTVPDYEEAIFRTSYVDENGIKESLVATNFRLIGARRIFPCWDEPAMKATFNISIKHHSNYKILSNVLRWTKRTDKDKTLSNFGTNFNMSTNSLMMVMIPKFDYVMKIRKNYVCRPHLKKHMRRVIRLASAMQVQLQKIIAKDNRDIPEVTHITIPKFQNTIIGHLGLIIYNEGTVIYDKQADAVGRKIELSRLVAYAMAKVWFHDVAAPIWWTDLWLSEGAAQLFGAYAMRKIKPNWRMDELFAVQSQHESLQLDIDYDAHPVTQELNSPVEIKSLHSFYFFIKAPVIVRMLQYVTIDQHTFFKSFGTLFSNQFQRITMNALLRAIQDVTFEAFLEAVNIKTQNFAYTTLNEKLHNWITRMHYPVLKVMRDYENGEITISQENINVLDSSLWWIPITYTTQKQHDFSRVLPTFWLEPRKNEVRLNETCKEDEWIIVNLQQAGYYRVKYDVKNWRLIANYLNFKTYKEIHVLNRAQLIDDAYHFMMKKQLDYEIFFNLTNYLSRETDYIAWYPMIKIFEYLSGFLPFQSSYPLKYHMLKILNGLLKEIGYEEAPEDNDLTKCLRQEAAKWACILDDPRCREVAKTKLKNYLKNPESHRLLPGWKQWTYCNGLKTASDITWIEIWHLYARVSNYTTLEFASCSGFLIPKFISRSESPNTLQHRKRMDILYYIVSKVARRNLNDTLKNFEEYIFYYATDSNEINKILTIIINHIYSETELYMVMKYLRDNGWDKQFIDIQHTINIRIYCLKQQWVKFQHLKQKRKSIEKKLRLKSNRDI